MKSFILLTFLFLGLAYYEFSGGNDFVPEARPGAELAEAETAPLPVTEVVTRSDTADPADVNALPGVPERLAQPLVETAATEEAQEVVADAVADAISAALSAPAPEPATEESPVLVSLAAPSPDWRQVDASALNVRAGPSTNDSVVTRLERNDEVLVVSELDDGWALVQIASTGAEGWVATRFLTQ